MMRYLPTIFFIAFLLKGFSACSQQDSTLQNTQKTLFGDTSSVVISDTATKVIVAKDSAAKPQHDPHKATIRSAIIPGWGQAYNRQYWKIPLVYGLLGVPAGFFVYNNSWYHRTKDAYSILVNEGDTSLIDPRLKALSAQDLQYYRNYFRKNRDYSALYFLLAWGINVVDATVFGHLKNFDVSDDLSMSVKPDYNFQTKSPSVSLAFSLKNEKKKLLPDFK